MKVIIVAAMLAAMAVTTIAQADVYKWQDDLCEYKANFDSKKYTAKQIKNSHFALEGLTRANLNSSFAPMDIRALDKLSMQDLDTLTDEYKRVKSNVERLDVVPEAKEYKQDLLKTIDDEYKTERLTILAYLDPIQAMRQSPLMCKQYLEPFFKNETAVQHKWQQFTENRIQQQVLLRNEGRESYRKFATDRYEEEKAYDPANYAKISLLTFGFGNCVNHQGSRPEPGKVSKDYQKLNKTLFGKSLTMVCDEP